MVLEALFPINGGFDMVYSRGFIFLQLIIFSIVRLALLFVMLLTLTGVALEHRKSKAFFIVLSVEALNFILKVLLILNFLNLPQTFYNATTIGVDNIIFIPSIIAMLFSIPLIKKAYDANGSGGTFWYVWLVPSTLAMVIADLALLVLVLFPA